MPAYRLPAGETYPQHFQIGKLNDARGGAGSGAGDTSLQDFIPAVGFEDGLCT